MKDWNNYHTKKEKKKWNLHIEQSIKTKEEILFVTEDDNKIIGFCYGGVNKDKDLDLAKKYEADLELIYILDEYHNKGIGSELVLEFVNQIQNIGINSMIIWVLEENSSKEFYKKLGGKIVRNKVINISGKNLTAIGFGWDNLSNFKEEILKYKTKNYWDNEFESSTYDYKRLADKKSWQKFIEEVKNKNVKSVLDLGSGGGHWSIILARAGIEKIKAVDISENAIKNLDIWAKEENLNIETEVKEIQNYSDGYIYDLIICNSVLDHLLLEDLKKTLKNISNLLNEDGYAYISFDALEENSEYEQKIIFLENGYKQYEDGMIWKYYDEYEIRELLLKYFDIYSFTGTDHSRKNIWIRRKK